MAVLFVFSPLAGVPFELPVLANESSNDSREAGTEALQNSVAVSDSTVPEVPASQGITGDCTWTLNGTVLTISGSGAMGAYSSDLLPEWGKDITKVMIEDGVTSVGACAFKDCTALETVVISDSVTTIGNEAFRGCKSLKDLTLGMSVKSINYAAFRDCARLSSIVLSKNISTIGSDAFRGCTGITTVWYEASAEQKEKITIKTDNSPVSLATWYCNACVENPAKDKLHTYEGCLYTECKYCGEVREAIEHFYDNACDDTCNSCGATRTPASHVYDSEYDADCNECGFTRIPKILSGTTGGCTWVLSGTKLTISGDGSMASYSSDSPAPWGKNITEVVIEDTVTAIGAYSFYGCNSLKKITLPFVGWLRKGSTNTHFGYIFGASSYSNHASYVPASLKEVVITNADTIGQSAFSGCTSLKSITVPSCVTSIGEYAFYGCTSLLEVTIGKEENASGNNIMAIDEYAFQDCTALKKATVGDSVKNIGEFVFYGCTSLADVVIGKNVTSIGRWAFLNCIDLANVYITDLAAWCKISFNYSTHYGVDAGHSSNPLYYKAKLYLNGKEVTDLVIPDGVTYIAARAFFNCSSITSVTIPDSVTSIGDYAFDSCSALSDATIGDNVTAIGNYAFYCCRLSDVAIGNSVTTIGDRAFYSCDFLTAVTIPNSVTSIGECAFYDCDALVKIIIGDGVKTIGVSAFEHCDSLADITIGNSATTLGDYAFRYCTSLKSITVPSCVTSIGASAFSGCTSLLEVTIGKEENASGNNIMAIGNYAFQNCTSLKKVTVGDSVKSIGERTFYGCSALHDATIGDNVTTIGSYAFSSCSVLDEVWYEGTEESWGNLSIGTNNSYLTAATRHYIDSMCDATCSNCDAIRIPSNHKYDHAYDASCNECGALREVSHVYEWVVDEEATCGSAGKKHEECKMCHKVRNANTVIPATGEHVYDDHLDTSCNTCGEEREAIHIYDNACDTTCNECSATREITHSYAWFIDTDATCSKAGKKHEECKICHKIRSENTTVPATGNHVYDNDFDTTCNACGFVRQVVAENAPTFYLNAVKGKKGDTVKVVLSLKNNPGIVSLKVDIGYDANILKLVSVEGGIFDATDFGPITNNPLAVNWYDTLNPNNSANGDIAILTFKVKEDAPLGDTAITLSYDGENVYDFDFKNVSFATQDGKVTVVDYFAGDVNGDGLVNNKDTGLLLRYINSWDVEIDLTSADVNGDGVINNKDLGILERFINGWDTELN